MTAKVPSIAEIKTHIKTIGVYELAAYIESKEFIDLKVLTNEQAQIMAAIIRSLMWLVDDWHNGGKNGDESAHEDIREYMKNLEAKFRNHRHETGKTFSAKPEY